MQDQVEVGRKDLERWLNEKIRNGILSRSPIELATVIKQMAREYAAYRFDVPVEWVEVKSYWVNPERTYIKVSSIIFKPLDKIDITFTIDT